MFNGSAQPPKIDLVMSIANNNNYRTPMENTENEYVIRWGNFALAAISEGL